MPSVTVVKPFYDLKAHKDREAGETFEADGARAEHIRSMLPGYVTVAEEPLPDLRLMTVAQLRDIASERGAAVPKGARKADIIALLEG